MTKKETEWSLPDETIMKLSEIAKAWIEMWNIEVDDPERKKYNWVDDFEYEAVYENPDQALYFVLEILKQPIKNESTEVLAAGPLEQVLAVHGPKIIEKVEQLAESNDEFAILLGGVWQNDISDEVWKRVKKVRARSGWDVN